MKTNLLSKQIIGEEMYNNINETIIQFDDIFNKGKHLMQDIKYLSTGDKHLDEILGGGYAFSKLTELSGISGTGKTLLALKAIKEIQDTNKLTVYVDASRDFNLKYLEDNNIDKDNVLIIQPESIEQLAILFTEILKPNINEIGLIIIDTIADLNTKKENEMSINTNLDISRSKIIKAFLNRISNIVRNQDTSVLILNQLRSKYDSNGNFEEISCYEKWINITCHKRIRLYLDEDNDICVNLIK